MKNISILIIGLFWCLTAFAQQVPLNELVSITLPKKAVKATKEQLKQLDRKKIQSPINIENGRGDFYKLNGGNTLLKLKSTVGPVKDNYLEDLKKGLDAMYKEAHFPLDSHRSTIKTINNYKVLIERTEYEGEETGYYMFFCRSNTQTSALNGILEYNIAEKAEATAMLDELLKSMKFKK